MMPLPLDPELRAQIITDVTVTGAGVRATARRYGVDPGTVSRAVAALPADAVLTTEKGADLLTRVLRLADTTLEALTAQAEVLGDRAYLRTQPARDVAVGFGVMFDKLQRLADVVRAQPPPRPPPERE